MEAGLSFIVLQLVLALCGSSDRLKSRNSVSSFFIQMLRAQFALLRIHCPLFTIRNLK